MADPTVTPAAAGLRRARWALAAVAFIAVAGGTAGAYFGLRGAHGPGSGPGDAPPARAFAAAAYDEARHQVVLFGGTAANGTADLDDTWTWDGSSWTQQHPSVSPPARAYAAMTYDPHAHDVLLVGGRGAQKAVQGICGSGSVSSSGSVGPPSSPVSSPPIEPIAPSPPPVGGPNGASMAPCMASVPSVLTDTWTWDGSNWHDTGQPAPSGILGPAPAVGTDPATGQVLLVTEQVQTMPMPACPIPASPPAGSPQPVAQSCAAIATPAVLHTWVWSGSAWSDLSAQPPQGGTGILGWAALVPDPATGHLALFRAGATTVCGGAVPSTAPQVAAPCPLGGAPSTSGGSGAIPFACCTASETTWNGTAWSELTTSSPTAVPPLFQLVPDEADRSVVAYSSEATWTWSGQAWSQHHPSRTPGIVSGATMVYDGSAGRVLLFGGMTAPVLPPMAGSPADAPMPGMPAYANALWSWDGSTWSQLSGTAAPPAPSTPPVKILPAPASPPVTVVPPIVSASPPVPEPCVPTPVPAAAVACPGKPPVPLPTATPL
ncbi:MAG: kelch repeat-containing protein [Candidatus Dormibacteria bacterium]